MKVSSLVLRLSLLMGATALHAQSGLDFKGPQDFGLQNIRDKRSYSQNKDAHNQVERFMRQIQQGEGKINRLENENNKLELRISQNDARKTDVEQNVNDAMKKFVHFLVQRENLGQADTLLELIPDAQRSEFNQKLKQMIPHIENYDRQLDEFDKALESLNRTEAKLAEMSQANEIGRLRLQKDKLVEEYQRLNDQNEQMEQQKRERAGQVHSASERLEALRIKESQLERDIDDLQIKRAENNRTLKTDDIKRKQNQVLGKSDTTLLSPNEKNNLVTENREAKKEIYEKSQELKQLKEDLKNLEEQLTRAGQGKIVFMHDQLSQKLDEINDVQTKINKIKAIIENLGENQKTQREKLDGKEEKLDAMKEELTDGFKEIVNMIKGLPVSKSDDDLARTEQIIESAKENFPPSGVKKDRQDREDNFEGMTDMFVEQSSGSFDQGSVGSDQSDMSRSFGSKESSGRFIKPDTNVRAFIAEMKHYQKNRSNAIPPRERCERAISLAANVDERDKEMLANFLNNEKRFMGVTYRAIARNALRNVLKTNPSNVGSLTDDICH